MDEDDAVDALCRLGLSTYEARVFIALQKLGDGTASDIADVVDVPRSQVYGAADALEDRGLIEVQHATPIRYRPVSPNEAESRLQAKLDAERDRAINYLETVEGSVGGAEEREADVWTVHGGDAIDERLHRLVGDAADRIYLGADEPAFLDPDLRTILDEQVSSGVSVTLVSGSSAVLEAAPSTAETMLVPPELDLGDFATRAVVVDGNAVLLAVRGDDGEETAIWSADTAFAATLAQVVESWFRTLLD